MSTYASLGAYTPKAKDAFKSYISNGNEGVFSAAAKLGYRAVTQYKFPKEDAERTETARSETIPSDTKQKSTAKKAAKTAANAFLTVIGALAGLVTFLIGTAASPVVLLGSSIARGCEVLKYNIAYAKAKQANKYELTKGTCHATAYSDFAYETYHKVAALFSRERGEAL